MPCLATGTPAAATTKAAAVETLIVVTRPPPVPQVSTSRPGDGCGTGTITARMARAAPATSAALSPRIRRPRRSPAACAGVAAPDMRSPRAAAVSSAVSSSCAARRRRAMRSGSVTSTGGRSAPSTGRLARVGHDGRKPTRETVLLSNLTTSCAACRGPADRGRFRPRWRGPSSSPCSSTAVASSAGSDRRKAGPSRPRWSGCWSGWRVTGSWPTPPGGPTPGSMPSGWA